LGKLERQPDDRGRPSPDAIQLAGPARLRVVDDQFNRFVVGAEGDWQWSNLTGNSRATPSLSLPTGAFPSVASRSMAWTPGELWVVCDPRKALAVAVPRVLSSGSLQRFTVNRYPSPTLVRMWAKAFVTFATLTAYGGQERGGRGRWRRPSPGSGSALGRSLAQGSRSRSGCPAPWRGPLWTGEAANSSSPTSRRRNSTSAESATLFPIRITRRSQRTLTRRRITDFTRSSRVWRRRSSIPASSPIRASPSGFRRTSKTKCCTPLQKTRRWPSVSAS
jgi:hypothetical protein